MQGDIARAKAKMFRMSYVPNKQSATVALWMSWQHDWQKGLNRAWDYEDSI